MPRRHPPMIPTRHWIITIRYPYLLTGGTIVEEQHVQFLLKLELFIPNSRNFELESIYTYNSMQSRNSIRASTSDAREHIHKPRNLRGKNFTMCRH